MKAQVLDKLKTQKGADWKRHWQSRNLDMGDLNKYKRGKI